MPTAPFIICNHPKSSWALESAPVGQVDVSHLLTIWVQHYWPQYTFSTCLSQGWPKGSYSTFFRGPSACHDIDLSIADDITNTLHHIERLKRAGEQITLTFSRTNMLELDALLAKKSIREQFDVLTQIVDVVGGWRLCYAIGIEFSEVFLAEEGHALPAHYRHDVDRVVTRLAEYQHCSAQFSYQFAKVFFGIYSECFVPKSLISSYIYAGWWHAYTPNRLAINDLTHILEVKAFLQRRTDDSQIVLRLSPQINLDDLQYCRALIIQKQTIESRFCKIWQIWLLSFIGDFSLMSFY